MRKRVNRVISWIANIPKEWSDVRMSGPVVDYTNVINRYKLDLARQKGLVDGYSLMMTNMKYPGQDRNTEVYVELAKYIHSVGSHVHSLCYWIDRDIESAKRIHDSYSELVSAFHKAGLPQPYLMLDAEEDWCDGFPSPEVIEAYASIPCDTIYVTFTAAYGGYIRVQVADLLWAIKKKRKSAIAVPQAYSQLKPNAGHKEQSLLSPGVYQEHVKKSLASHDIFNTIQTDYAFIVGNQDFGKNSFDAYSAINHAIDSYLFDGNIFGSRNVFLWHCSILGDDCIRSLERLREYHDRFEPDTMGN